MHGSLDFLLKSCTGRYFEFPFCWRVNWGSEGSLRPRSWEEHYKLIKPAATTIYYIPEAWWTFRSFGFIFLTSEMKWLSQRKLRTLLWVPCRGVWEERRERNREAVAISEDGSGDKGQEGLVEKAWPPSLSDRRGDSGRRTRALFSFSLPPESTGCSTQWQFFKKKKTRFKKPTDTFLSRISQIKARRKRWCLERLGDSCNVSQQLGERAEPRPLFSWPPN